MSPATDETIRMVIKRAADELAKDRKRKRWMSALAGVAFLFGYGLVWRFYGWRLAIALFVLQFAANLERSNR